MTAPVTLLMAIHSHQPVGNFGFVFEQAYAKAYEPFLGVLERHPGVRLALHYSGCLLDWLVAERPEFLARVRALVNRGQVEVLASGYYEPILPMLPEDDRQGQLALMRQALRTHFGAEARGAWLTERVWEPDLPGTLAQAGIRYTMVDTNQFAPARPWLPAELQVQDEAFWDLLGCYITDHAGSPTILFPASKRLRYWLPFQPVDRTIEFLRRLGRSEPVAITFADDGEKFGLWPKTYRWVYEEGWLDQFFAALERERAWLTTATFQEWAAAPGPAGRAYLPAGSYEEMLEWSGGQFRNFFTKYPEANALYHKMLRVSAQVQTARASSAAGRRQLAQARQELYAGQCNCAYWHGVFGGLYLGHLRRAVYARLLAAERLAQGGREPAGMAAWDVDGDGHDEIAVRTPALSVVVDPAEGGTVTEWSLLAPRLNLLDVLTRRPEPYHEKLRAKSLAAAAAVPGGGSPASIHDALGVKEENLASRLAYDDHRRAAFHDYALQSLPTLDDIVRAAWGERRLWSMGAFRLEGGTGGPRRRRQPGAALDLAMVRKLSGGRIRKTVRIAAKAPIMTYGYELEGLSVPVVGLEFNLSLRDERYLREPGEVVQAAQFTLQEPGAGVWLELALDPPATLMHFPIETVSESEEGLERTYQGLCLMCFWTPGAAAGSWAAQLRWTWDAAGDSAAPRLSSR